MSEVHYLTYDPEAIWSNMITTYVQEGGDMLYPGDEKEMIFRAVLAWSVQMLASVDQALRMQTLRYAEGEYLDLIGSNRNCPRISASAAQAQVQITFTNSGVTTAIPSGTRMTPDGEMQWELVEEIIPSGYSEQITADIRCCSPGIAGNSLSSGTEMQMAETMPEITRIEVLSGASGGHEAEDDDTYRERIRTNSIIANTTGPRRQYEAVAKSVSASILDVYATSNNPGTVHVFLLVDEATAPDDIVDQVYAALDDETIRPMTDTLAVQKAKAYQYNLRILYTPLGDSDISQQVDAAVQEYCQWQELHLGQPFNPERLVASIYMAGAERVQLSSDSWFCPGDGPDGTPMHFAAEYTKIERSSCCTGTIVVEVGAE